LIQINGAATASAIASGELNLLAARASAINNGCARQIAENSPQFAP
jgi:hypothetical protein